MLRLSWEHPCTARARASTAYCVLKYRDLATRSTNAPRAPRGAALRDGPAFMGAGCRSSYFSTRYDVLVVEVLGTKYSSLSLTFTEPPRQHRKVSLPAGSGTTSPPPVRQRAAAGTAPASRTPPRPSPPALQGSPRRSAVRPGRSSAAASSSA